MFRHLAIGGLASLLWWFASILGSASAQAEGAGIRVGNIADVDLDEVRRVIDESDDVGPPTPTSYIALSLDQSLEVALENNLRIQIGALDVEAQIPQITAAKARFDVTPGVSFNADGFRNEDAASGTERGDSQSVEAFVRQEVATGGAFSIGMGYFREFEFDPGPGGADETSTTQIAGFILEARQPLMRGGRTYVARAEITNAKYELDVREAQLQADILGVIARTKAAYYSTVRAARLIEVTHDAIDRDLELLSYSRALFDAGRVSLRDVYSAEISLSRDRARLAVRESERELAQNRLRDVLGLPIDAKVEITDQSIPFRPVQIRLDEWIGLALQNRPELMGLRAELGRAALQVKLRKNDVLPQLDVFGRYRQDVTFSANDWIAGLEFSVPLGNRASKSRLTSSEIEYARLQRFYTQRERQIELEVREIEIQLRSSVDRLKQLTNGVEQAKALREVAVVRCRRGQANNLDITDADSDLQAAQSELLQAVVDYATNIAFLEASIGQPI